MRKDWTDSIKKLVILNSKTGKLVPMGNLQVLFSKKELELSQGDYAYLSADNNIYALSKINKPYVVNKEYIGKNIPFFKLTSKDFSKLDDGEYFIYPFEVMEYYKSKYVLYDREKYPGTNIVISNYELPLDSDSKKTFEEYSKDTVRFVVNSANVDDTVDLLNVLFNEQIREHSDIEFSISLVPKNTSVVTLSELKDNVELSIYDMMFIYPRGIVSKIVKNGHIVKLYSKELGDISSKVPKIIKEASHIPYNKFIGDCFLCYNNMSITTIKNMINNDEVLDDATLVLFDSSYADENLEYELPNSRYQKIKPCALGTNRFKVVGLGSSYSSELMDDLYEHTNTGIIVLSGNYINGKKYIKTKGIEYVTSVESVSKKHNSYIVTTNLGSVTANVPCVDGGTVILNVGESVFEFIDSGYNGEYKQRKS